MAEIAQLNESLAGRYRIEREIGRGGMAVVFLARDLKHSRPVALKVMDPGLGALLGTERFLAEIGVTANLQHPNILPLFDSGEVAGHLFYVMPFVEGESLRARLLRERAMPVEDALHIASRIASALDHAHRQGVVHRDLKPENILLRDGEPIIADFGIALAVSRVAGERMTQSGISLGTPQYMSPEQAAGETMLDGRSDLYSLGAVLYEMLSGEPPHSAPTAQALVARVIRDTPRPLRDARATVPEHVERVVALALEKHPADRIQSGRAFAEALSGKLPTALWPTPRDRIPDPRPSLFVRSAPWAIAVVGIGAALALPSREGDDAPFRVELVLPGVPTPPATLGAIALSPDGRVIAFVSADSVGGSPRIHLRHTASLESQVIEGTEGASQLFFSPAGDWIGYYVAPYLWKVPASGGPAIRIGEVPAMLGGSWSRDGEIVVSTEDRLARISDAGGTPRPFTTPDSAVNELSQRWPLVLPGGRTVAYTARGRIFEEQRIALARFDGSTRILDLPGTAPLALIDDRLIYSSVRNPTNDRNGLMAVPIDVRRRVVTGDPIEVEHGVESRVEGLVVASVSASGSLLMLTDPEPRSRLVRFEPGIGERPLLEAERHYTHPRLSPDGTRLIASMDPPGSAPLELLLWDLGAGTEARVLTDSVRGFFPEWSADGQQILFTRQGAAELWRRFVELTSAPEPVPGMTGGADYSLTKDGRRAAVRVNLPQTFARDLIFRDLDRDTVQHPLVVGPEQTFAPRLSPDGKWVAYFVGESRRGEVWITPFPGPGPRYQVSRAGGYGPVWSPDGRRLYYQDGDRLLSASLSFAGGVRIVGREEITGAKVDPAAGYHANFDVTPDGRAFVFPRRTEPPPAWVFVHSWTAGLTPGASASGRED